jgi:hypothetical protein
MVPRCATLRRLELQGLASERSTYHTDLLSSSCVDDMLWACQARAWLAQAFTGSPRDGARHLALPPQLHGSCATPHQERELFFCVLVHVAAPVPAWRAYNIRRLTGCSYTSSPPATLLTSFLYPPCSVVRLLQTSQGARSGKQLQSTLIGTRTT